MGGERQMKGQKPSLSPGIFNKIETKCNLSLLPPNSHPHLPELKRIFIYRGYLCLISFISTFNSLDSFWQDINSLHSPLPGLPETECGMSKKRVSAIV